MIKTQVCIVGAGAGGIGCAYRLIKNGIKTVIVDKNSDFGGTMVFSGVDGWEPGVSLDGIHRIIADELSKIPNACHVTEVVPNKNIFDSGIGRDWEQNYFPELPWGFSMPMGDSYDATFGRCISLRGEYGEMKRFQFEGEIFSAVIRSIFKPYSEQLTSLFGYYYKSLKKENSKILSITASNGIDEIEIEADYFVDASGDIVVARDAGCAYAYGTEGINDYSEPSAPPQASESINGVSYVFRVSKTEDLSYIDPVPKWVEETDLGDWKETEMHNCISFTVQYPNGDINFNMLPTMQGREYFALGENADKIGKARVYAYWNYLQKHKNMYGYTLNRIFNAGIRESYRLVGKYVLREQDLREGSPIDKTLSGKIIAIADHALDVHGESGMSGELMYPYKIPIECAITKEFNNLFVACRGASFSHIAASSARLSRTILSMGEGVGEYISAKLLSV